MDDHLQGIAKQGRGRINPLDDVFPVKPSHLKIFTLAQSAVPEIRNEYVIIQRVIVEITNLKDPDGIVRVAMYNDCRPARRT